MATEADLLVDQGSRWQAIVGVTVDWLTDLTGYQARGQVRASRTLPQAEILVELTPYLTVDVPSHQVRIDIPADITAAWSWNEGHYDLELFSATPSQSVRFLQGKISVDKEVTR